jgi:hypothetical protein
MWLLIILAVTGLFWGVVTTIFGPVPVIVGAAACLILLGVTFATSEMRDDDDTYGVG